MLRTTILFALAMTTTLAASAAPPPGSDTVSSPLDSFPARFDYVSNNAPFVVFDIAPRTLNAAAALKAFKELKLTFVATEPLHHVDIFTYVVPTSGNPAEAPTRVACGSTIAGHHSCSVPTREALLLLKGGEGLFGLRIEAEGIEGERSTVRITLPVKAGTGKPVPAKVVSPMPLTLLAAPLGGR
jgi:hypothetical protein